MGENGRSTQDLPKLEGMQDEQEVQSRQRRAAELWVGQAQDVHRFATNPGLLSFIRPLNKGETGNASDEGVAGLTHVLVTYRGEQRQGRILLTREEAEFCTIGCVEGAALEVYQDLCSYGTFDIDELRNMDEQLTWEQHEQRFLLPHDRERLRFMAASVGMGLVLQYYPRHAYREKKFDNLDDLAYCSCIRARQLSPHITNDYYTYRETYVNAFFLGYRLAVTHITLLDPPVRADLLRYVASTRQADPQGLNLAELIIRARMEWSGASSVCELM